VSAEVRGGGPMDIVCIACPIGCRMSVAVQPDGDVAVSGNRCPRGDVYGREEVSAPRRMVTAVVPTGFAAFPFAPVRTDRPLARAMVAPLLELLYSCTVGLPIRQGDVLIEDFHGVRVLITRTLPPDEISPVGESGPKPEGKEDIPPLHKIP
jgi:CxxC motif-containing protein